MLLAVQEIQCGLQSGEVVVVRVVNQITAANALLEFEPHRNRLQQVQLFLDFGIGNAQIPHQSNAVHDIFNGCCVGERQREPRPLPVREGSRFSFRLQCGSDFIQNHCHLLDNFTVSETNDLESVEIEDFCPVSVIFFLLFMDFAIHFHHQFFLQIHKIHHEIMDGVLPSELESQ